MKRIPLSQSKFALVDDEDFEYLNQWKWCAHKEHRSFYAVRRDGKSIVRMHREILKLKEGEIPDHKDQDGLNNQKSNLRIVSEVQNRMNTKPFTGFTSKYKGVYRVSQSKKWAAQIGNLGRKIYLGCFVSEEDAAKAYDTKAVELFGDFAYLNFPHLV